MQSMRRALKLVGQTAHPAAAETVAAAVAGTHRTGRLLELMNSMLTRLPTGALPVEARATRLHLLLPSCTSSISAALRLCRHTARSGASESLGGTGEQVGGPAGEGASCSCEGRGLCIAAGWGVKGWERAGDSR